MILSPERGFAFHHAPKTGGTALALALEADARPGDLMVGDTPGAKAMRRRIRGLRAAGRVWKHATHRDARGLLADDVMARLVPVTLVRNPWDRVVSFWAWGRAQAFDHPMIAVAKAKDFPDFARDPLVTRSLAAQPYAALVAGGRRPLFLRLEEPADLRLLRPFAGRVEMPRANVSARERDWRGYYDARARDAVAAACADDIARFGYAFD
ncbi:sulfotransferase family 2 domain-containing protein [Jannaschia sp. Os4]|uniref:sulfotransferase family 2 domain-containing protein n=1 Tax=Jannaschia sp. Os4 TaxID=2807617 RepID=UPI00193941B3|nr:sulfotransferase family 2 domain-containing protein [Jannaschia sp. Os4]MBM2576947.1 sulfotransferase family 2 domain-containing protein [Jannaschia sp. Os4]